MGDLAAKRTLTARLPLTEHERSLLIEALTYRADYHDRAVRVRVLPAAHKARASALRELGCKLLAMKVRRG